MVTSTAPVLHTPQPRAVAPRARTLRDEYVAARQAPQWAQPEPRGDNPRAAQSPHEPLELRVRLRRYVPMRVHTAHELGDDDELLSLGTSAVRLMPATVDEGEKFQCPILHGPADWPVRASDGVVYDLFALVRHVALSGEKPSSMLTGALLTSKVARMSTGKEGEVGDVTDLREHPAFVTTIRWTTEPKPAQTKVMLSNGSVVSSSELRKRALGARADERCLPFASIEMDEATGTKFFCTILCDYIDDVDPAEGSDEPDAAVRASDGYIYSRNELASLFARADGQPRSTYTRERLTPIAQEIRAGRFEGPARFHDMQDLAAKVEVPVELWAPHTDDDRLVAEQLDAQPPSEVDYEESVDDEVFYEESIDGAGGGAFDMNPAMRAATPPADGEYLHSPSSSLESPAWEQGSSNGAPPSSETSPPTSERSFAPSEPSAHSSEYAELPVELDPKIRREVRSIGGVRALSDPRHPERRSDPAWVLAAVCFEPAALELASDACKDDDLIVREAFSFDPEVIAHASPRLRGHRSPLLGIVLGYDGNLLRFFTDIVKNQPGAVSAALSSTPEAMQYASDALKAHHGYVYQKFIEDPRILKHVAKPLRLRYGREALDRDPMNLQIFPAEEQTTRMVMACVERNGLALEHAAAPFKDKERIVRAATRQNKAAIEHASPRLKDDERFRRTTQPTFFRRMFS